MEESWTILKVLQWTTAYFTRSGVEQPRANAEVLLAHVLGTERIQLYLRYDQPLSREELARYRDLIRRRAAHEPTQYLTGKQEFWSLEFEVTPAVLIPRPETEVLVEKALEHIQDRPARILDLGTGSGAIAVALAHERPRVQVVATDASPEALKVAVRNARRHGVQDRVTFLAMDLLTGFSPSRASFDLILSNPPYIGDEDFQELALEVSGHEPVQALRGGGSQGLAIIRRLLHECPLYLKAGGALLVEIGHGQAEILKKELSHSPHFKYFGFVRDYSGILRILHLQKSE